MNIRQNKFVAYANNNFKVSFMDYFFIAVLASFKFHWLLLTNAPMKTETGTIINGQGRNVKGGWLMSYDLEAVVGVGVGGSKECVEGIGDPPLLRI